MVFPRHRNHANIHWGRRRTYERILVNSDKNQTKTKRINTNNVYKSFWWPTQFRPTQNTSATNTSLTKNLFLRKSRVLTDIMSPHPHSQSFTVVIVISSIFLFLTMTITAAVIVFCRKRNTVFALQKSDEEPDYDFELEELTDLEYTDTEFESEADTCSIMRNKYARSNEHLNQECDCSPTKEPLVTDTSTTEMVEVHYNPNYLSAHYKANCGNINNTDQRGAYQKIAMATVLDKQGMTRSLLSTASDSEDSLCEQRLYKMCGSQHNYYGIAGLVNADVDSDSDTGGILKKTLRNFQGRLVCGGNTINYESMTSISSGHDCVPNTASGVQDEAASVSSTNPLLPPAEGSTTYPFLNNVQSKPLKSPDVAVDLGEGHTDSLLAFMRKHKRSLKNIVDFNKHSTKRRINGKKRGIRNSIPRTKSDSYIASSN